MAQEGIGDAARDLDEDVSSIRDWVTAWGAEVARVDFAAARLRFDPAVIAFGTHADVLVGIDDLQASQWTAVWPKIADFQFMVELMRVVLSPDRLLAIVAVPWRSTGFDEEGTSFPRPGRASIVVRRSDVRAPWLGIHTHFSLARGVPPRTFGRRAPKR